MKHLKVSKELTPTAPIKKVAIVYPYFPHYREPLFHELNRSLGNEFEFLLVSCIKTNLPALRTIDRALAEIPVEKGGLNWWFVQNLWIGKWLWQKGLLKKVWNSDIEVFIFNGQFTFITNWLSILLLHLRRKKVYLWTHGLYGNESFPKAMVRWLYYQLAHGLFLFGNRARRLLMKQGFPAAKLHVVFNSLDYQRQKALRDSLNPEDLDALRQELFGPRKNDPLVCFVGRILPEKKLDMIFHAIKTLQRSLMTVNCVLVGDGPHLGVLREKVAELKLIPQVLFFGPCYDETLLSKIISASDLCVSPGSVGLTAIHSLVYGTPVVTHDDFNTQKPEFEAIIPVKTGGFFKKDDIDSLCGEIRRWTGLEKTIREQIRMECYKVIDLYYNPEKQAAVIYKAIGGEG